MDKQQIIERLNYLGNRISYLNAADRMSPAAKVELDQRQQEFRQRREEIKAHGIDWQPNKSWLL